MEWYSNKSWEVDDKEKFFAKLSHTPQGSKVECLKIMASELIRSQDLQNIDFAEKLLNQVWKEKPEKNFEKIFSINSLEENNQLKSKLDLAISYYRASLDNENINPKVDVISCLHYAEMIIKLNETDQYDDLIKLLKPKLNDSLSPILKYKISSILSLIYASKKDMRQLRYYKKIAKENANFEAVDLQYNEHLRVVKKKIVV